MSLNAQRELEGLIIRRRTLKHSIRVLLVTAKSAKDNRSRINQLEELKTQTEERIKELSKQ